MNRLSGKAAIVLGAATKDNMAQCIAKRFRTEGAQVVVAGRNMGELRRFAAEIDAHAVHCDITNLQELRALAEIGLKTMKSVSIAVNSTGWGLLKPFLDTSDEELQQMTALQFVAPFQFCQEMIKVMTGGGSIIQLSSATSTIMLNDHAAYMAAKAGTDHLIRCVANEFGQRGIRANSISPGLTESPMTSAAMQIPGMHEVFRKHYPLGRIGTREDIAAAAVWLASDQCFMTGENLQVNGGLTLRRNPTAAEMAAVAAAASQPPNVSH